MKERHALLEHTSIYLSVQIQCTYWNMHRFLPLRVIVQFWFIILQTLALDSPCPGLESDDVWRFGECSSLTSCSETCAGDEVCCLAGSCGKACLPGNFHYKSLYIFKHKKPYWFESPLPPPHNPPKILKGPWPCPWCWESSFLTNITYI